jgi:hypothetical protein
MRADESSTGRSEGYDRNRRDLLRTGACTGLALAFGSAGLSCCPQRSQKEPAAAGLAAGGAPSDWAMIAYCCLECDKCDVYIATQKNDDALRAKVAAEWKMDAEKLHCDGCKSDNALFNCEAKKCAVAKGLPTCAHCRDFSACDKEIWTKWPQLKEKVESMRGRLRLS